MLRRLGSTTARNLLQPTRSTIVKSARSSAALPQLISFNASPETTWTTPSKLVQCRGLSSRCLSTAVTSKPIQDSYGGNGVLGIYPVMRHMANLESVVTYEGTDEVHTLVLGLEATGIAAFS